MLGEKAFVGKRNQKGTTILDLGMFLRVSNSLMSVRENRRGIVCLVVLLLNLFGVFLGVMAQAGSMQSDSCQRVLSAKALEAKDPYLDQDSVTTAIIDELVDLIWSSQVKAGEMFSWRPLLNKGFIDEKKAEIERKIGRKATEQVLSEVQDRVLSRLRDRNKLRDANQSDLESGREGNTSKVRVLVLKPRLNEVFRVHRDQVISAVFSHDGKRFLSSSADDRAHLLDLESKWVIQSFAGHFRYFRSAIFSLDDSKVLTVNDKRSASLWEVATGKILNSFGPHKEMAYSVALSPDGSKVATASHDGIVKIWDATKPMPTKKWAIWMDQILNQRQLRSFRAHHKSVNSVVFSPDGTKLLTTSDDHSARVWDVLTGELLMTFRGHSDWVVSAVFSPDSSRVLTASEDHTIILWDVKSGERLLTIDLQGTGVRSAVLSPDGSQILAGLTDKTASIWDAESGVLLHQLRGHEDIVNSVAYSPDGRWVLTGASDKTVMLWSLYSDEGLEAP
jgi:WD40 repeat protein